MKRKGWWLTGLVGLAILAGACGGGDKKEATSSPSSSGTTAFDTAAFPAPQAASEKSSPDTAGAAQQRAAPAQAGAPVQQQIPNAPLPGSDRKIIYNVTVDLTVGDVQDAFQKISTMASANGGLIADSNMRQENKERRATLTIRVPVERFQPVLNEIRGLGTVDAERSNANDVTEEYTDLQSRQRALEATETQLFEFLKQAKNIQEVLTVQDRLNSVRAEIERVKGRQNLLTRLSDLATIQVQIKPEAVVKEDPKPKPAAGPLAALRRGWEASIELLDGMSGGVLTAVAFSWWLVPFAALGIWAARREQRRRAATVGHIPAPPAGAAPTGGGS